LFEKNSKKSSPGQPLLSLRNPRNHRAGGQLGLSLGLFDLYVCSHGPSKDPAWHIHSASPGLGTLFNPYHGKAMIGCCRRLGIALPQWGERVLALPIAYQPPRQLASDFRPSLPSPPGPNYHSICTASEARQMAKSRPADRGVVRPPAADETVKFATGRYLASAPELLKLLPALGARLASGAPWIFSKIAPRHSTRCFAC